MEDTISAIATALGVGAVGHHPRQRTGKVSVSSIGFFRAKEPLSSSRPPLSAVWSYP